MTARAGLSSYITEVRQSAELGTADYTLGTVTYWSDDQIQTYMDRFREDIYRVEVEPQQQYEGGTVVYKKYYSPYQFLESGTPWELEDQAGNTVGTALYSVDYEKGIVTFSNDTAGSAYFVTTYAHNLNLTIAKIWRQKASHYAMRVDFSTDNHSIKGSQYQKHCIEMAKQFEQSTDFGFGTIEVARGDRI
jgi:hypothetical protein